MLSIVELKSSKIGVMRRRLVSRTKLRLSIGRTDSLNFCFFLKKKFSQNFKMMNLNIQQLTSLDENIGYGKGFVNLT